VEGIAVFLGFTGKAIAGRAVITCVWSCYAEIIGEEKRHKIL